MLCLHARRTRKQSEAFPKRRPHGRGSNGIRRARMIVGVDSERPSAQRRCCSAVAAWPNANGGLRTSPMDSAQFPAHDPRARSIHSYNEGDFRCAMCVVTRVMRLGIRGVAFCEPEQWPRSRRGDWTSPSRPIRRRREWRRAECNAPADALKRLRSNARYARMAEQRDPSAAGRRRAARSPRSHAPIARAPSSPSSAAGYIFVLRVAATSEQGPLRRSSTASIPDAPPAWLATRCARLRAIRC